jgi:hypothetical protein
MCGNTCEFSKNFEKQEKAYAVEKNAYAVEKIQMSSNNLCVYCETMCGNTCEFSKNFEKQEQAYAVEENAYAVEEKAYAVEEKAVKGKSSVEIDGCPFWILSFDDGSWCTNTAAGQQLPNKVADMFLENPLCMLIALFTENESFFKQRGIQSPHQLIEYIRLSITLPGEGQMLEEKHICLIEKHFKVSIPVCFGKNNNNQRPEIKGNHLLNSIRLSQTSSHYLVLGLDYECDKAPEPVLAQNPKRLPNEDVEVEKQLDKQLDESEENYFLRLQMWSVTN